MIEHRYGHAADEQAGDLAGHQGNGQALEDRVGEDDCGNHRIQTPSSAGACESLANLIPGNLVFVGHIIGIVEQ